jgi:hypothetical protein
MGWWVKCTESGFFKKNDGIGIVTRIRPGNIASIYDLKNFFIS